jgi:hypothetical protein
MCDCRWVQHLVVHFMVLVTSLTTTGTGAPPGPAPPAGTLTTNAGLLWLLVLPDGTTATLPLCEVAPAGAPETAGSGSSDHSK